MLRLSTVLHKASCNRPLRKTRPRCSGDSDSASELAASSMSLGFRV